MRVVGEGTVAHQRFNTKLLGKDSKIEQSAVGQALKHAAEDQRRTKTCCCYGCDRVSAMFVGSRRIGWLRFCSKHREVAKALALYFHWHRNAQ
jgi:hypothetical protein